MTQEILSATDVQDAQDQPAFLSSDLSLDFSDITPGAQDKGSRHAQGLDLSELDADIAPVPRDAVIAAQTLNYTSRYSNQQIMEARHASRRLGISLDEALQRGSAASQLATQAREEDLSQFSPRLLESINAGKAAYADRGDLPHLNGVATAFDSPLDMAGALSRAGGVSMQGEQRGLSDALEVVAGFGADALHSVVFDAPKVLQNMGRALTHGAADFNRGIAGTTLAVSENIFGPQSTPAQWVREALQWIDRARPEQANGDSTVSQFFYDFLRSAPPQAANILGALVSPPAALAVMGTQIAGNDYADLREKGVSPLASLTSSAMDAAVQAPMERFALGKGFDIFKAKGMMETAKKTLEASATEFITEYAQKAPELVSNLWGESEIYGASTTERLSWFYNTLTDIDTLVNAHREAVYEGLIGAAWGGLFGGVAARHTAGKPSSAFAGVDVAELLTTLDNMAPEMQQALALEHRQLTTMQQRQHLGEALTKAAAHIDASKTTAQDREAMAEVVEELLPESFRQTWIGPDEAHALYQSAVQRDAAQTIPGTEAETLLTALGTDVDTLQAAVEQGAPLPLSTAGALTLFQGEVRAEVLDALRATADGVSGAEAKAYDPTSRMDAALEFVRSSQRIRSEVSREVGRITQEMLDIKSDDGKRMYPEHVAKAYATLNHHQALAMHAGYGADPALLLARRNFARAEDAGAASLHNMATDAQSLAQAAMYRNKAANLADFVEIAQQEPAQGNKSFYGLGEVQRAEAEGEVILSADVVKHVRQRHQDFQEWERIIDVVSNGVAHNIGKHAFLHTDSYAFVVKEDKTSLLVIATSASNKKGKRVFVDTAFRDSSKNIEHWIKNNAALYQSAGGSPAYPSPKNGDAISELKSGVSDETILQSAGSVNADTTRGVTRLTPESADVRIFASGDLSTIPHESAHIFLDDLMTVAADDGSIALANMQRRVEATLHGRGIAAESAAAVREQMQTVMEAAPEQRLTALYAARESLKRMAQDARQSAQNAAAAARAMQQQQEESGQSLDPTRLPPWTELQTAAFHAREDARAAVTAINAVTAAMQHLRGLEKARADVATLCRHAGVAVPPHLASGGALLQSSFSSKAAPSVPVVRVDAAHIPVDVSDTKALRQWLRESLQGTQVTIKDNGSIALITGSGLEASLKRRGTAQRQTYAGLEQLLQNAVFDSFESADARHANIQGQNIYYAALSFDGQRMFSVKIKLDVARGVEAQNYKDHRVAEIEIAPSLYAGHIAADATMASYQTEGTISEISLDVLRGKVKPSGIADSVLYQEQRAYKVG